MNQLLLCILFFPGMIQCAQDILHWEKQNQDTLIPEVELFNFFSNGKEMKGKIYLPPGYNPQENLPSIFLIDFTEQHFKLATDEFEKVIDGVHQIPDLKALVVSLEGIPDIDAEPESFKEHFAIYKDMAAYVDNIYMPHSSRTFIGKGSESGVVLMAMFLEDSIFDNYIVTDPSPYYSNAIIDLIQKTDLPEIKSDRKLHFSFSTSNDRSKCLELIRLLRQAKYPWLQFEAKEYTDSDYEHTYPISYAEGVQFVFKDQ